MINRRWNKMPFTDNEIATYLLCAQLPQTKTTPLTILEWNAVVKSLGEHQLQPEILLTMSPSELLNVLTQATASQKTKILEKVEARQHLGISMFELEDITRQGFGVLFRSHMPKRLKKLTQKFLPPFFYYAGNPDILSHQTFGVVGARNANSEELVQTANIANEAAQNGIVIISGGAKGVDTAAVEAALENNGKAVIFPSEGLTKWVKRSEIRQYILNEQLLLMSTQKIDAPFSGRYAMLRNRYIHAPSDAVLVASSKISGSKSSGTWEGVIENLKQQWSPLYVIGKSEGVLRLLAENHAKRYTSLDAIFKQSSPTKLENVSGFAEQVKELIKSALADGYDRSIIEKTFREQLAKSFESEILKSGEKNLVDRPKYKETEQLNIEALLIREEGQ